MKTSVGYYKCANHTRTGRNSCSSHYIRFEQLYEVVLNDIQQHTMLVAEDREKYVNMLIKASSESGVGFKSS